MARHYIKDSDGKDVKNGSGDRMFWSDRDGDRTDRQTVYRDTGYGSEKSKAVYNPVTGKFIKK